MKEDLYGTINAINISKDKNDKDSIYVGDLIKALSGNKEARENILELCKRQENKIQDIENNIPKMLDAINKFFDESNKEKDE